MTGATLQDGQPSDRRPVVSFLGPLASFSHQATKSLFDDSKYELVPTVTIPEIFDVVQAGNAVYGVVPFENSTHGPVTFTLNSLADRDGIYGDLSVCGELYLDVHHFLLGRKAPPSLLQGAPGEEPQSSGTCTPTAEQPHPQKPRSKPLTSVGHIRRIYSHPQGFGQTVAFLSAYLRGVDTIDVSSTSRAAQLAREDQTGTSAAIASELAAEMHGLDILARCIEDREDNTTRFFVIRKGPGGAGDGAGFVPRAAASPSNGAGVEDGNGQRQEAGSGDGEGDAVRSKYKSLLSFTVPHRSPGALADVLDCFKRRRLNLTSINSLPSLIQPFQYLFFVEFEGSRSDDPEGRVKAALEDVGKVAQSWRWLGSWERVRF